MKSWERGGADFPEPASASQASIRGRKGPVGGVMDFAARFFGSFSRWRRAGCRSDGLATSIRRPSKRTRQQKPRKRAATSPRRLGDGLATSSRVFGRFRRWRAQRPAGKGNTPGDTGNSAGEGGVRRKQGIREPVEIRIEPDGNRFLDSYLFSGSYPQQYRHLTEI